MSLKVMADYSSETVAIPITRWKRGRHGVLPKTAGMSKLISTVPVSAPNIPAVDVKAGYKTTGFVTALPPEPKGKGPEHAIAWLQYADAMTSVWAGHGSFKVVGSTLEPEPEPVIVPRGTFIGPKFELIVPVVKKPEPRTGSKDKSTWIPREFKR